MNAALIDSLGWTLLHFIWQGALVGCATALALTALRNGPPGQRYLVACTGLLACVLWPAAELALRLQDGAVVAHIGFADAFVREGGFVGEGGWSAWLQAQLVWVVAFWAICALVLSLRMTAGLLWIQRARTAPAANAAWEQKIGRMAEQFGVRTPVGLRVVDDLASPLTAGWWRPVILVPASLMSSMPIGLLEALLAHEMAHVRRADYLVNLGQNMVEIVLFYHPAVWWMSHRIRVEREQIADDMAARHLGEPRRLAQALSELERWQFSSHHLAVAANGGDLLARVRRLVRPDRQGLSWKAALPALGLAAACLSAYAHASLTSPSQADTAPALAGISDGASTSTRPIADFRSCKKPVWPASSLAAGHTGTVTLGFRISEEGRVLESRLENSSGDPLLDEAARSGVSLCRFSPGTENGKPVAMWMRMQYVWTLE